MKIDIMVNKISNWKCLLLSAVLFILVFLLINGDLVGVKKLEAITGGIGMLDMEFSYTPEEAYMLLAQQGAEGRMAYKELVLRLDFLYPLTYTLFFMSLIGFIYSKLIKNQKLLRLLVMIPVIIGICDYLENIMVLNMLARYPREVIGLAITAAIFTMLKWIAFINGITVCVIGFVLLAKARKMKFGA